MSLAVHPQGDEVSQYIVQRSGQWEGARNLDQVLLALELPVPGEVDHGHTWDSLFVDVGAHVGWYALHVATQGEWLEHFIHS